MPVNKTRPKGGEADTVLARDVIGEVDGRLCVVIDDRIDTGGTIVAAADILMEHGATDVWAMATHGVLADPATDRLKNSVISRVVITDTVPISPDKQIDKLEVVSSAKIISGTRPRRCSRTPPSAKSSTAKTRATQRPASQNAVRPADWSGDGGFT